MSEQWADDADDAGEFTTTKGEKKKPKTGAKTKTTVVLLVV